MNQIPIYQHPYVDVFKATKLTEWESAQKEGEVTEVYDKQLTKNVIKVSGVTPASNYFQLPAQKHLPKKSLGLIGKYVYAIVNVPAGKTFVLHFDYILNETRLVRLSLSNIYKEFKNLNGTSIQVPVIEGLFFNKWTMICINAQKIFGDNQVFAQGQKESFFMRSLQITANIQVRGIYTSDIKYTVQTLPKDMSFKLMKGQEWFSQYAWFEYPLSDGDAKENKSTNVPKEQEVKTSHRSQMKSQSSKVGAKSVKFTEGSNTDHVEEEQKEFRNPTIETQIGEETKSENIERTLKDIQLIKEQMNLNLEEKNLQSSAQVTFYYDQDASMYPRPVATVTRTLKDDEKFVLKPNPIMKLDRTIGVHPKFQSNQVFFNKDAKLSREIIYTSANHLLGYQNSMQRQRLFYDHPTGTIEHLYVEGLFALTATRGANNDGKDFEIAIWDVQDAKLVFSFKPPLSSLHSISLNKTETQDHVPYLCLSGKDFQKRDLVLIYSFNDMISNKKVEIYARQLCDFDLVHIRFNDALSSSLVACGREHIRFFKIKNGHMPGQSVTLHNTGRGKVFNRSLVDFTINEKGSKKPNVVFVTTDCGLLYIVNYASRQIDKIIQIHEEKITSLLKSPTGNFLATASINGYLRLWTPDFSKLISEVNTQQNILSCDANQKEIVVLGDEGTISVLDMEESCFHVIIRSHLDNVQDICFNKPGGKVVSVGLDQKIYVWNTEKMDVVSEFSTQNDLATKLASSSLSPVVAIGFKSGFIRIFDLSAEHSGKLIAETMIFEQAVMDLKYSEDGKFLAVFYRSCKIVIFSVEKGYHPVKSIDYEFPNENYFSLGFSPDGRYLANISSNANNITVWETKNFSLKFHLDLTGDMVSKLHFAPNGKDLVILTTSSKLKFYRISFSDLKFIKDIYGVTDLECLDFEISPNNKFIACCGKEGVVRIYDYYMRGGAVPNCQAFIGHYKFPKRVIWSDDMRYLLSIGDCNGIFRWSFFGDKVVPSDISKCYEELEEAPLQPKIDNEPVFNHDDLLKSVNYQLDQQYNEMADMQHLDNRSTIARETFIQSQAIPSSSVQYNASGYRFEQYDIELKKVLQCSIGSDVKNNLVWNKERRYIAYSSQNIVIIEDLNQEKSQRLLSEGNDKIYQIKMSPNERFLLAYTQFGQIDGAPRLIIWDAVTLKKLNLIAIEESEIVTIEFSKHSNMLLVVSRNQQSGMSCMSIWDFLEGHKDILTQSKLPINVIDARWNYYMGESSEFVTISERKYHFWKITPNLTLQYQEGDIPKQRDLFTSKSDQFTACEFVVPTAEQLSVYMLLGLSTGYVWVIDTRCNQFIYNVKILDGPIRQFYTSKSRVIAEGTEDQGVYCWMQGKGDYDQSDPKSIFLEKEIKLTLDGFPSATSYEESCGECVVSTSSGTLWFLSWVEAATIKIKSCHSPRYPISSVDFKYLPPGQFQIEQESESFHQFDQNYSIATSGKDGVIKLWNMYDSEFLQQFIVPKEECVAIAMHQFKPYMVASFTDGFLRFFEIQNKSKTLGRCQLHHQEQESALVDYVVSIKILPSGNHILGASKNGQIILIYVQQWDPLAIKIEQLASINTAIHSFDVSFLEPYNKWLVGTENGKVIVYNRKDFNAFQQEIFVEDNPPRFNFMDSFNVLDYVDNSFTESRRCNTLDHYYSVAKRNLVTNEVDVENRCEGIFSNADLTLHISFIAKAPYLFIRNFELHQVVRKIGLQSLPLQLSITPNSSFFIVLQSNNVVKMIDFVNSENTSEITTIHEEAKVMKICPNGRYILTGGSKGDICIWQIKKREMSQDQLQQLGMI